MQHAIDEKKFGALGAPMVAAVQACVHCGFCLTACPTYRELGQEMDTPRGRIVLMKQVLEGTIPAAAAQPHIDRCLGCLACEPACPSGVAYRDLISPFRALMSEEPAFAAKRTAGERMRRWLVSKTVPHPARFRLAARAGALAKRLGFLTPPPLRPMLDLVPDAVPRAAALPEVSPARGERRARVALLAGCAQQVLEPGINLATIDVLTRNGVEVVVPRAQACCGGLAWHTGDLAAARSFARRNLAAFPADVDAVVTNAAGCGSALHEYPLMLKGTEDEARAQALAGRTIDVSVFLLRLGLRELPQARDSLLRIAYHDACHLANAQGVRAEPRDLLRAIPGVEILEIADPHLCCGSAGSYNIDQPAIAASLGEQKARAVIATEADVVATGNIGCLTQLRTHLARLDSHLRVRHTVQVLRDAYDST
ncbi:MAG: (Fe-S)-binding protein [Opitutaceae bacterium]